MVARHWLAPELATGAFDDQSAGRDVPKSNALLDVGIEPPVWIQVNDRVERHRINPRSAVRHADRREGAGGHAELVITEFGQHPEIRRKICAPRLQ